MKLAAIAYEAYRAFTGGKSLASGENIPMFDDLPGNIKKAWEAAAAAVEKDVKNDLADFEGTKQDVVEKGENDDGR